MPSVRTCSHCRGVTAHCPLCDGKGHIITQDEPKVNLYGLEYLPSPPEDQEFSRILKQYYEDGREAGYVDGFISADDRLPVLIWWVLIGISFLLGYILNS